MIGLTKTAKIMKKFFIVPAVIALAFVCSCNKEQEEEGINIDITGEELTEFKASLPGTKTYLGEATGEVGSREWPNLWSNGDVISVNGVTSVALSTGDGYVGTDYAIFHMASVVSGPFYAAYPASAVSGYSAGSATITIPATQTFVAGSYDPASYIMLGKSNTETLSFNPMMGLVQLTTTAPASGTLYIKSITVEPVGDEKMSGTFTTTENYAGITGGSSSAITISAASGTTKTFGTVFTFAIPAQNYASGVRFRITAVPNADGTGAEQTMVFSKQSGFTVETGKLYPLTAPAFKESAITLSCPFKTSSSAGFEWSGANSSDNKNFKKTWRLAIYTNSACTDLFVQHDIPGMASVAVSGGVVSTEGVWKGMKENGNACFIVGGLSQGTTYYCKVTDIQAGVSNVISFTTEAFTPVSALSPSGNILVAEDFSELGWGPAFCGNASENHRYAGWSPTNAEAAGLSFAAPTGVVTSGYYKKYDYSVNDISTSFDYSTAPRFSCNNSESDGWGWYSDGGFNGYIQAGHLRIGGWNGTRTLVVLPTLSITSGKYATVDVTIKVGRFNNSEVSNNPNFAVFFESGLTLGSNRKYTGTLVNRRYFAPLNKYGHESQELTYRINGLTSSDHLMVGCYNRTSYYNRFILYSVKVEKVSESSTETFDITDAETLELFRSRVAGGAASLNGNVINDIDASSIASSWAPIAGYTGTLTGNDKTISGLTKPFFADLQGNVAHLIINSVIDDETDSFGEGPAIFAQSLSGGGSLSYCTSKGSVSFCPSTAVTNATRYVAGLVAYVTDGTVTNCTNEADVSFLQNSKDNDMNVSVGGVIAIIDDAAGSCSDLSNSGDVSVGIISSSKNNRWMAVGGAIGYVDGANGDAVSALDNSGEVTLSGSASGQVMLGGAIGRNNRAASGVTNSKKVKYSGSSGNELYVGGAIGFNFWADSTEKTIGGGTSNSGAVEIDSSIQTGQDAYIGGVAGRCYGTITATNSGTVTITRVGCKKVFLGGIVGQAAKGGVGSGSVNQSTGSITISNLSATSSSYFGGVAGVVWSTGNVRGTNNGAITLNSTCSVSDNLWIGGVVGYATRGITGTNNGTISNSMSVSSSSCSLYLGGIAGENSAGSGINSSHNTGSITNYASSAGHIYVGGISGKNTGSISSSDNVGNVSNEGTSGTDKDIEIGGISGHAGSSGGITSSSNGTSSAIGGRVSNSADSGRIICVGGISGENSGRTFTSCFNRGEVTNSGAAPDSCIVVGGLVGWSGDGSTYTSVCYNTGAVSNTGKAGSAEIPKNEDDWVDVGGLLGLAYGTNTLTGTSSVYNYNSGTVTENSESFRPYVGGICGEDDVAASDFTYCANLSGGNVTVKNNTRHNISVGGIVGATWYNSTLTCTSNAGNIYLQNITDVNCINVGGILGVTEATPSLSGSDASHRTTNSGNIEFTTCTIHGAVRAAGILSWWDTTAESTVQYCTNTGTISTHTKSTSSTDLNITNNGFNYVGGIVGGSAASTADADKDYQYKTIQNCDNTNGHITIYSIGKFRIGGIAAHLSENPQHCTCTANITYARSSYASTDQSQIGGIVGYQIKKRSFVDIHYNGTVTTSGSYCYASGIIGYTGYDSTFDNCSIQGSIQCLDKTPGLFFSNTKSGGYKLTCKNGCTVKKGTTLISSSGTTTINSASDFTKTTVVGGTGASNSPTYSNLSVID